GADGSYTVGPTAALVDGTFSLRARAVDAAGNVGPAGAAISLTILTKPPAAPAAPVLLAADDTGVVGDGRTAVRRPRLTGHALPGGPVDLLDALGNVLASTTAALGNGTYTIQPGSSLNPGTVALRVRVRDVAGNLSPLSTALNLTIADAIAGDFEGDG